MNETEMSDPWKKARALMKKAELAQIEGDSNLALSLANEAVSIVENSGLDPYLLKISREMMFVAGSKKPDFSGVIAVMQETLAIYRQENSNLPQTIDLLINLAVLLLRAGNKQKAIDYLDQAEELLKKTTANEISQYLPRKRVTGSTFLAFKFGDVDRLRRHIQGMEST
ncbi:MAG: tetratricopeptide repeat protein [Chloroflexi bacterium]|nr:tetratricopeptide repeat protein [Chloroflexota bacterium]